MPYGNLLNATCKIERPVYDEGATNSYNETMDDDTMIADNVVCRLEKLYDRELVEAYGGGDHDKGIYVLYLKMGVNIRASDLITVYETVKVTGFSVAVINGLYRRTDSDVINGMPVYIHTSGNHKLFYDAGVWKLEEISSGTILYRTSGESLTEKVWVVVDGTGTTGKSKLTIIQDFHYNTNEKPTQLIINDIEDAGGGKHHHLQCFCRYRKEIS